MSEIIEAIDHVIARIKDEKHWTIKVNAKDKNGCSVNPRDKSACSWCSFGAMRAEYLPEHLQRKIYERFWILYSSMVTTINDTSTHQEIMNAWNTVRQSFAKEE